MDTEFAAGSAACQPWTVPLKVGTSPVVAAAGQALVVGADVAGGAGVTAGTGGGGGGSVGVGGEGGDIRVGVGEGVRGEGGGGRRGGGGNGSLRPNCSSLRPAGAGGGEGEPSQ